MARLWITSGLSMVLAVALASWSPIASANDELIKLEKDPKQWVMPAGDYANTRYSALNQITKKM